MTISDKDLLLAILSMDAYNQGGSANGIGINHGSQQIGSAIVRILPNNLGSGPIKRLPKHSHF